MSETSQAADQVTKEITQLTATAVKLAGAGIKNLAALALALSKDKKKLRGKTKLNRLLREGCELKVVALPKDKLKEFTAEAKRYGILFSAVQENEDGTIDILVRAQDAPKINRVFERINYHGLDEYKKEQESEKNSTARAASKNDSPLHGQDEHYHRPEMDAQKMDSPEMESMSKSERGKINIRERMEHFKRKQQSEQKKAPTKAKAKRSPQKGR